MLAPLNVIYTAVSPASEHAFSLGGVPGRPSARPAKIRRCQCSKPVRDGPWDFKHPGGIRFCPRTLDFRATPASLWGDDDLPRWGV